MQGKNRQIVLASRPAGWPAEENFRLEETPVPEPSDGEVLVRNLFMSVDPYMRGRMNDRKSYIPSFQIGKPLEGGAVGRVMESRNSAFQSGDYVANFLGWREYFTSNGDGLNKVNPAIAISAYLGVLGIPGFTGWYGLKEIGQPKSGETLVVSGAAGATGSFVVQMGKILGCRVVGSAGSQEKCDYITRELGADAAVNYKSSDLAGTLRSACPSGIDIYYENTGGPMLDAVLLLLNPFSRIPLCGMISQYNNAIPDPGPRYLFSMIANRTRMQGFIIRDHLARLPEFMREAGGWLQSGKLKYRETVVEGIENAPRAFLGLLKGENIGKMVVKLGDAGGA